MSTARPTIFGGLQFGGDSSSATLFAESFIPQTYIVSLSETITGAEADDIFSSIKPLADTVTLTSAQVKVLSHAFNDSVTGSSALTTALMRSFSESASISDGSLVFTVKNLTDFLLIKEWISVRNIKAITWVDPEANANLHDTLWGKYTFGSQLFGGVKPSSSWSRGTRGPSVWTNSDGAKYNY